MFAAAATVTIALIVGIAAAARDDETVQTDTPPATTTTTAAPAPTSTVPPATTEPATTETDTTEGASPFGDAEPLPSSFTGLQPGPYWSDTLAVPFSFEIDQSLFVQQNRASLIALSSPSSRDPGDKSMDIIPLPSLWSPGLAGLDVDVSAAEMLDHLEGLSGRLTVSNDEDIDLDGPDGIRFDIEVDTSSCGADTEPCVDVARNESGLYQELLVGWRQRIWVIELGDEPMAIVASIWTDRDAVWLDVVERYVSTITFADG